MSVWNVDLAGAVQKDLVITPLNGNEGTLTVDRLDVAQFVYLLVRNADIRYFLETITSKIVLILGRFTDQRKAVLEAIRAALRTRGYLPIVFDWEKPASRDIAETVSTLAHLAKFVIADITDAQSIPQELATIVPHLPSVPVQPLLLASQREYPMFEHFIQYRLVLPVVLYTSTEELMPRGDSAIITPLEARLRELQNAMHNR